MVARYRIANLCFAKESAALCRGALKVAWFFSLEKHSAQLRSVFGEGVRMRVEMPLAVAPEQHPT